MKTISLVFIAISYLIYNCSGTDSDNTSQALNTETYNLKSINISVEGMTCNGCEQTVQNLITKIKGVKSATASYISKNAIIKYNPALTDISSIVMAIKSTGYKPLPLVINEY